MSLKCGVNDIGKRKRGKAEIEREMRDTMANFVNFSSEIKTLMFAS